VFLPPTHMTSPHWLIDVTCKVWTIPNTPIFMHCNNWQIRTCTRRPLFLVCSEMVFVRRWFIYWKLRTKENISRSGSLVVLSGTK